MLQGEELVRVAFGELLRFAVGAETQRQRLAEWGQELKRRRKESREQSFEAMFSLPSGADFEGEMRRIHSHNELPSLMHAKNEAHFLLIAIKNIDRMAQVLRRAVKDDIETVRCVQQAISSFEVVAPEVTHLRNLHEHLDEFLREKGDAFSRLPDPQLGTAIAVVDDDVAYFIGGKAWSLGKLADAANDLVTSIRRCVSERDERATDASKEGHG